mgnify:CR=1 FL=1
MPLEESALTYHRDRQRSLSNIRSTGTMKLSNATDPRVSTSQHDSHQFRFRNKGRPTDVYKQDLTFHLPGHGESNCCVYRARLLRESYDKSQRCYDIPRGKFILHSYAYRNHERDNVQNSCSNGIHFHGKVIKRMLYNANSKHTSYRYIVGS